METKIIAKFFQDKGEILVTIINVIIILIMNFRKAINHPLFTQNVFKDLLITLNKTYDLVN